ncbi:MAG: hypothetical protein EOO07_14550, partial [Chitinophagaceae bacterium]
MKKLFIILTLFVALAACRKKGTETEPIPDPTPGAKSYYAVGSDLNTTTGVSVIKYWKNGVVTNLTDGTKSAFPNSIAITNTEVLIAGVEHNGTNFIAKLWRNGVATTLSSTGRISSPNKIFTSGNDVYVTFTEKNASDINVIKLWKNGIITSISDETKNTLLKGLYVNG